MQSLRRRNVFRGPSASRTEMLPVSAVSDTCVNAAMTCQGRYEAIDALAARIGMSRTCVVHVLTYSASMSVGPVSRQ